MPIDSKKINLVPEVRTGDRAFIRTVGLLKRTSFVVLALYLGILLLIAAAGLFLNSQKQKVLSENQGLVQELAAQSGKETLLETTKNRLNVANSVLEKASVSPQILYGKLISLVPANIQIEEADAKQGQVLVSATSPDSSSLGVFLNSLEKSSFSSVVLNEVSLTKNSGYRFSVTVK